MDDRQQFDKWVQMWDQALAGMPKPEPAKATFSFFGPQSVVPDEDAAPEAGQVSHWQSVLERADGLLNEAKEEGAPLASGPGPGVKFTHNPVHFASHGSDQSPSPNQPARVTPNFTGGDDLRQLEELRVKLEKLESSLNAAAGVSKPTKDFQSQIDSLWKKIDALSNKLTPEPTKDLA